MGLAGVWRKQQPHEAVAWLGWPGLLNENLWPEQVGWMESEITCPVQISGWVCEIEWILHPVWRRYRCACWGIHFSSLHPAESCVGPCASGVKRPRDKKKIGAFSPQHVCRTAPVFLYQSEIVWKNWSVALVWGQRGLSLFNLNVLFNWRDYSWSPICLIILC